jgi:hypothetical protein
VKEILVGNGKTDGWIGEYIGRPMLKSPIIALQVGSVLGNPFRPQSKTKEGHDIVVMRYREWLWRAIAATDPKSQRIRAELERLKNIAIAGKKDLRLDCWCYPLPCHADVVKEAIEWAIANEYSFWNNPEPITVFRTHAWLKAR